MSLAAAAEEMPYHPYRKVGERYYSIQPIYDWLRSRRQGTEQPMEDWLVAPLGIEEYRVFQVLPDGLLVKLTTHAWNGDTFIDRSILYFLKHYPRQDRLADGDSIKFIALKVGTYQYTDSAGASRTVTSYDYGSPYNPFDRNRDK